MIYFLFALNYAFTTGRTSPSQELQLALGGGGEKVLGITVACGPTKIGPTQQKLIPKNFIAFVGFCAYHTGNIDSEFMEDRHNVYRISAK